LKAQSSKLKVESPKPKVERGKGWIVVSLLFLGILAIPVVIIGQEMNRDGWPIPDLKGLIPYSIQVKQVDRVEKMVEKFYIPDGGHIARISGNGKTFAYAVDSDREPPIDYFLLDPEGFGKFTLKFRSEDSYKIPEWISH
jgi:hypothetical protein